MDITQKRQYNQSIGKYKLLSSNAGVGSVIATRWGVFVMPLSISQWEFINRVDDYDVRHQNVGEEELRSMIMDELGVELIRDERFIDYLKNKKEMPLLKHFVAIPQMQLSSFNTCQVESHPLNKRCREITGNANLPEERFSIPAINFPKWFYSRKKKTLKPVDSWRALWRQKQCNDGKDEYFAPPRDPESRTDREMKNSSAYLHDKFIYEQLNQVPLLLVCPNGHITDVPWDKYFAAKLDGALLNEPGAVDLFNYISDSSNCPNGGGHELMWLENRNNAESWGVLKCSKCHRTVSLEGLMNIKPPCNCDKPWENGRDHFCRNSANQANTMRCVLATSNSVYYAQNESSVYIPQELLFLNGALTHDAQVVLDRLNQDWFPDAQADQPDLTKESFAQDPAFFRNLDRYIRYARLTPISDELKERVKNEFLGLGVAAPDDNYRYQEYFAFMQRDEYHFENEKYLSYRSVPVPESLENYITAIKQVYSLAETTTQLSFSRVSMPEMIIDENGRLVMPNTVQRVFSGDKDQVRSLPAVQSFGEGIFIALNQDSIARWLEEHSQLLNDRYTQYIADMFKTTYDRLVRYSLPSFYLLHTFSHIILRELEFSCGYPTASLKERLYYSNRMIGVLIYTADGSEGSLGGLVSQGHETCVERIIKKALEHAKNCSSDPLCWENEGQMNFASCFACTMVSETACEERNLALDRRILVDEEFGFFRDMVFN